MSEVTIDTLTGENIIERVDILHDAGNAINPAIEFGQIEGRICTRSRMVNYGRSKME